MCCSFFVRAFICPNERYRLMWNGTLLRHDPEFFAELEQTHGVVFARSLFLSIASDGYGFDTPPASSCAPTDVVKGLSAFRLLHRCGSPVTRESFDEVYPLRHGDPARREGAVRPVHRERWVYDFGADTRMRIVTLRDGRVVDIELGNNGSARAGY